MSKARNADSIAAPASRLCWTLQALSDTTTVPIGTLRREIRTGRLVARRNGRRLLVSTASFTDWFDRLTPASMTNQALTSPHNHSTFGGNRPNHVAGGSDEDEAEQERLDEAREDAAAEAREEQEEDWGDDWERDL